MLCHKFGIKVTNKLFNSCLDKINLHIAQFYSTYINTEMSYSMVMTVEKIVNVVNTEEKLILSAREKFVKSHM